MVNMDHSMRKTEPNKVLSWRLLLPAGVVLFCVLLAYAIKGIYPFGAESVVHDDMGQCSVPIFYSIWDALHGNGSILYNLRTAGGVFISGSFEGGLSIFNILFFLICPRGKILESMSFFLLLKMMAASVTSMILFRSRFPGIHLFWQTILSVLYAFNPFLLQYYSNASWLEIVMILPLIFLGADKLFTQKKSGIYIFALAYSLILQLYISYMVVLFLFLDGAVYIFCLLPKAERKSSALRFGLSTLLAIALSAFSALPSFFYMTSTSRYQNTKGYLDVLVSSAGNASSKYGMIIIMTLLPLALSFMLLFLIRKKFKVFLYFGVSLGMFVLPVLFENINLLWHMGSYVDFSMRYAFLFHLMLLCTAGYVLQELPHKLFTGNRITHPAALAAAVCIGTAAILVMQKLYLTDAKGIINGKNFRTFEIVFALCIVFYLLLVKFGPKKLSCVLIAGFVLFESVFYTAHAVTTGFTRKYEYSLDYIEECDVIRDTLPMADDGISRIKNLDASLNTNYPLLIDRPSMSNFTHTIPSTIKKTMQRLGYSTVYTRILDTGGTLFTDALLGYQYAISMHKLPEEDYTFLGTSGRYMVYRSAYTLPFGSICNASILSNDLFSKYAFDSMNNIWHALSDREENLVDRPQVHKSVEDDEAVFNFDVEGTKELYLVVAGMTKRKSVRILVNGGVVPVPNLGEPDNSAYTTRFNNSVLDVGEFHDTHVTVRVQRINSALSMDRIQLRAAALDKSMLSDYCDNAQNSVRVTANGRTYSITAEAKTDDAYLFLPVTYDSAIRCRVNGHSQRIERAMQNFCAIKLQKGSNTIRLRFLPKGFSDGLVISIAALLLCVFWLLRMEKRIDKMASGKTGSIVLVGYYIADIGGWIALYIIPMVVKLYLMITAGG